MDLTLPDVAVRETQLGDRAPDYRGKVRDVYDLGDDLLIVATDRLSAYDSILPTGIAGRGVLLTQLSAFWCEAFAPLVPHHIRSLALADFPPEAQADPAMFGGRTMRVRKLRRIDAECVVRGYLAGSGWREYRESGSICGHMLPRGLRESERLPEPLFTPATKADAGHDENIDFARFRTIAGARHAEALRDLSLALYAAAARHAAAHGILIADTKFEFALEGPPGAERIVLIDEVLTPDSSRFWPADRWEPGRPSPSFDKQIVRDWLDASGWDHTPPAPALPDGVVTATRAAYLHAYRTLTAGPVHLDGMVQEAGR